MTPDTPPLPDSNSPRSHHQILSAVTSAWTAPDAIRFGFDEPVLVLQNLTPGQQRIAAGLARGDHPHLIRAEAVRHGIPQRAVDDFLAQVNSRLSDIEAQPRRRCDDSPRNLSIVLHIGRGVHQRGAQHGGVFARSLEILGVTVLDSVPRKATGIPVLAVVFCDFATNSRVLDDYAIQDMTSLPIVFGDQHVRVGPLLGASGDLCVECLRKFERNTSPHLPAFAAQQYARSAPLNTPEMHAHIAPILLRYLDAALTCDSVPSRAQWVIRVPHGSGPLTVSTVEVTPDPECPCQNLQLLAA